MRNNSIAALSAGILGMVLSSSANAQEPPSQPVLVKAVRTYIGSGRGNFVQANQPIADQIVDALGVPDGASSKSYPGGLLIAGCRPHDCTNRAAVVLDRNNKVLSAGLISFKCAKAAKRVRCNKTPIATLFRRRGGGDSLAVQAVLTWARSKVPNVGTENRFVS